MSLRANTLAHPDYRPDIDGLRAVAVLSVVVYHAYPSLLLGGFTGVDVFFVISGYLISTIIFQNADRGSFRFATFYARRIRRIFPALLLVLSTLLIFGWFGLLAPDYAQMGKHVLSGATFVSNLTLWGEAGYFDSRSEFKPLLHLWSLGVEEQFYILWPLVCWFLYSRRRLFAAGVALLVVLSFTANIHDSYMDNSAAFYSPVSRFWELLAGGGLAWWQHHAPSSNRLSPRWRDGLSLLGAGLLASAFLVISPDRPFPGWWALLPVAGTMLVILSGSGAWFNRTVLSNRAAVWFGLISYPLYLWHWPLISIAWIAEGTKPTIAVRACAVVVAIALAWLTWRYLERPIRRGQGRHLVKLLLGLNLLVALTGAVIWHRNGVETRQAVTSSGLTPDAGKQLVGGLWQYSTNQACLDAYPRPEATTFRWWFCMKSGDGRPTIILLGNSFANQLYPGFAGNPLLSRHVFLNISACDFGADTGMTADQRNPCYGLRSRQEFEFLASLIDREKTIRFAIIDGLRNDPDKDYIATLKKRIEFLEARGIRVVIFTPHLRPGFSPTACFSTPLHPTPRDCSFDPEGRTQMMAGFKPLVDAIKTSNPNVLFFDQNDLYCPVGDRCSFVRDGLPLHRDTEHISEYASRQLQPYFMEWARTHLPEILEP